MNTENKTPEEKKVGQLAGCMSVIYGIVAITLVIYSIYVLAKI